MLHHPSSQPILSSLLSSWCVWDIKWWSIISLHLHTSSPRFYPICSSPLRWLAPRHSHSQPPTHSRVRGQCVLSQSNPELCPEIPLIYLLSSGWESTRRRQSEKVEQKHTDERRTIDRVCNMWVYMVTLFQKKGRGGEEEMSQIQLWSLQLSDSP